VNFSELSRLIEENMGDVVEFGNSSCDLNPSSERLKETEKLLGVKLPPSYLWFVKNYGGGEVYGEEIYSIYPVLSEQSVGDIAYQTKWFRDKGFVSKSDVVISSNNFGEIFFLNTSESDDLGEYPVYIKVGDSKMKYADNFAEFLYKRISAPEA